MDLLNFLFPKRCYGCGRIGRYFCKKCQPQIIQREFKCIVCQKPSVSGVTHPKCRSRHAPDGLVSFFYYRGALKKALKAMKFRSVYSACEEIINSVPISPHIIYLIIKFQDNPILIPVPLHQRRLRQRGFNQAQVLGSLFADKLNIPLKENILKRIKNTRSQSEVQNIKNRKKNIKGAFQVSKLHKKEIYKKDILLFDDIYTTGATLKEATRALKMSGARSVWAVTVAH